MSTSSTTRRRFGVALAGAAVLLALLPGTAGADPAPPTPSTPYPSRAQSLYPSGSTALSPAGGGHGQLVAAGSTSVNIPFLEYYAIFQQSASRVAWVGTRPLVADSTKHNDTWRVDYVAPGYIPQGVPPGATVHSDGGATEVTWTTTAQNTWYSEHSWPYLAFFPNQYGQLYRVRYSVTGVFQFGSAFYTVTGDATTFT
jgi:hypothetical protein